MLETIPVVIIVSSILGFLAGLGVGGGSLLILWVTLALNIPQPQARILNLLFFLPSAIIASLFRWKQGTLNLKKLLPAIVSGCIAAAGFSLLGRQMDITFLKKLFGILLLVTGMREILYNKKEHP